MLTIKNSAAKSLAFLAAVVVILTACGRPGPRALFAGKKLLDRGRYEDAIVQLKIAATLLGTNALAYSYLGLACHQAGQLPESEKAYERALALDPDMVEVRYNLGCLWLTENKPDQAKTALTAYTLRRPGVAEGWLKLGTAQLRCAQSDPPYLRAAELSAAERSFNEAIRLNPHNPEALTGLGLARLQRNRAAEAAQFFIRALKEQPDYRPALLNLAIVSQEQLNDHRLALQKYREYLTLKPAPENAGAVATIVRQLEQEMAPSRAAPASTPAPQPTTSPNIAKPANAEPVRTAVATKPLTNVAHSPAVTSAAPPVTLTKPAPVPNTAKPSFANPSPPVPPLEVARVPGEPVLKATQDETAVAALVPAPTSERVMASAAAPAPAAEAKETKRSFLHRLNPLNLLASEPSPPMRPTPLPTNSSAAETARGDIKAASGPDSSLASVPRYAYKSPAAPSTGNHSEAERAFALGVQAHREQRLPEAIQAYRRALQSDPSFFDAWYNLGLAATEADNLPLALGAYEHALASRRESLDARYNFALVLKQANYPIDAAHELEKLLAIYPNDSRAHLALGNLYAQQLGQPAKARPHYVKVLASDPRNPQAGAIRYWLTDTAH